MDFLDFNTRKAFAICIVILWAKDAKSVSFISASLFFSLP